MYGSNNHGRIFYSIGPQVVRQQISNKVSRANFRFKIRLAWRGRFEPCFHLLFFSFQTIESSYLHTIVRFTTG